jgi:FtsX-like permease family
MAAVWLRAWSELRRRWRATVLLAVLVGLAGGVVLAAVAGARRTASVMDRFVAYNRPTNVLVAGVDHQAVARLPQVADADEGSLVPVALAPPSPSDSWVTGVVVAWATIHGRVGVTSDRPLVVGGRLPDPSRALEVAVDETLAVDQGLRPGATLRARAFLPKQLGQGLDSSRIGAPAGPELGFTVTGVVRNPHDLSPVPVQHDVIYLGANELYLTPAFWATYGGSVGNLGVGVGLRLHRGTADLDAFTAGVRVLPGGGQAVIEVGSEAEQVAGRVQRAMRFQAAALLVFAVLVAVTGLLVIGQGIARQVQLDGDEQAVLRAVGMTRPQLAAVALLRVALLGAGGAVLAAVLAVLASPLSPVGLARAAEIDPGMSVDAPVLALGAVGVLVAVMARAGLAAWKVAQAARDAPGRDRMARRSMVVDRVGRAGAGPSAVTGIRMALEPARGQTAAPVHTATIGAVVAVAAVAASLTFAASLDRLVRSPALQGWNWDVVVGNPNDEIDITPKGNLLARNSLVSGYSLVTQPVEHLDLDGIGVPALGISPIRGGVLPRAVDGREARSADEVALGSATLRRLGRSIGEVVHVRGAAGRRPLRIVGEVVVSGLGNEVTMLRGAVLTVDGLKGVLPAERPRQFIVEYAPGVDQVAAYASLQRDFGPTVLRPLRSDEVENLRRVGGLPFLLAALLAVLGTATLGHLLVTLVRRHRKDLAVLKTIGFLRGQVSATVAWQATALAVVALLVGLPVGVAAGRWAWQLTNQGLGSLADPMTPLVPVILAVPATVLVANLAAALPARAAAATRPAVVLRSE